MTWHTSTITVKIMDIGNSYWCPSEEKLPDTVYIHSYHLWNILIEKVEPTLYQVPITD